jgi:hypothetical protein
MVTAEDFGPVRAESHLVYMTVMCLPCQNLTQIIGITDTDPAVVSARYQTIAMKT